MCEPVDPKDFSDAHLVREFHASTEYAGEPRNDALAAEIDRRNLDL